MSLESSSAAIEEVKKEVESIPSEKQLDTAFIDSLLKTKRGDEPFPSLRIRDEVHNYHMLKWEKDLALLERKLESIIGEIAKEKDRKEADYYDADTCIRSIEKYIPDEKADKLPWDKQSKVECLILGVFLVLTLVINLINFPAILKENSTFIARHPWVGLLFCGTITLSAIGYKFAEQHFEVLKKYTKQTTMAAAIGVLNFSSLAIIAFLLSSFADFSADTWLARILKSLGKEPSDILTMVASGSIFFSEICTSMLFSKTLYQIFDMHGRKDKENPKYTQAMESIKEYMDIVNAEKNANILKDTIRNVKRDGLINYTQRADAYLVSNA